MLVPLFEALAEAEPDDSPNLAGGAALPNRFPNVAVVLEPPALEAPKRLDG